MRRARACVTAGVALVMLVGGCKAREEHAFAGSQVVNQVEAGARANEGTLEIVHRWPLSDSIGLVTALALDRGGNVHIGTSSGAIYRLDERGIAVTLRQPVRDTLAHAVVRALLVRADGRVLARDERGTMQILETTGRVAGKWVVDAGDGLLSTQLLAAGPGDTILAGVAPNGSRVSAGEIPLLVRMSGQGRILDTIFAPARVRTGCALPDEHFRSGAAGDLRSRYVTSLQWAPLASGTVVAGCNARYELARLPAAASEISRPFNPAPVSREERSTFIAAWMLRMRNSAAGPQWTWQGDTLPDHKPAFHRVLTGSDGRIWVWPAQPSRRVAAPPQWVFVGGPKWLFAEPDSGAFEVFTSAGEFAGTVALSSGLRFAPFGLTAAPVIRGDTLWLIAQDTAGHSAVVRGRVRWLSRYSGVTASRLLLREAAR